MNRYAYEHAERGLDHFASRVRSRRFQESYRRFKALIQVFAYCDFSYPELPTEQHLAWTWEGVDLAFRGIGDSIFHGCFVQMWVSLNDREKEFFISSIKRALAAAQDHTPDEVVRRFDPKHRRLRVRPPGEGYDYQVSPAISNISCKQWEGKSPQQHDAFLTSLGDGMASLFLTVVSSRKALEPQEVENE